MRTTSIQVIDRAAALLDALSRNDGSATLKILSAETGLHPSSAFRILSSLVEHGLIERDAKATYRLGYRLLQLGSRVHKRIDLYRDARPVLEALRDELHETVNLTVRQGNEVVYVERAAGPRMMRVEQLIGSRAPLHVTAVGKLFLAEGGREAFDRYVSDTGLIPSTPRTVTDPLALWAECRRAGERGFAVDREEAEPGVSCLAVPIRDHTGRLVAAVSVSAPANRHEDWWLDKLLHAGALISERLGYSPHSSA